MNARAELLCRLADLEDLVHRGTGSPETTVDNDATTSAGRVQLPAVARRQRAAAARRAPSAASDAPSKSTLRSPRLPLKPTGRRRRSAKPAIPRQSRSRRAPPSTPQVAAMPLPSPTSTGANCRAVTRGEKAIRVIDHGYLRRTHPDLFLRRFLRLHYELRQRFALSVWRRKVRRIVAIERAERIRDARRRRAGTAVATVLHRIAKRKLKRVVRHWKRRTATAREVERKQMLELQRLTGTVHKIDSAKTQEEHSAEIRLFRQLENATTLIQRRSRCYLAALPEIRRRKAAELVNRVWRGNEGRRRATAARRLRAAIRIQTRWRVFLPQRLYRSVRRRVTRIQAVARARATGLRVAFLALKNAALLLQRACRCAMARRVYSALAYLHRNFKAPTIVIQSHRRGILQRRISRYLLVQKRERDAAARTQVRKRRRRRAENQLFRQGRRINGKQRIVTIRRCGYGVLEVQAFEPHAAEVHRCRITLAQLRKQLRSLGIAQGFDTTPAVLERFVDRLRALRDGSLSVMPIGSTFPCVDVGRHEMRRIMRLRIVVPHHDGAIEAKAAQAKAAAMVRGVTIAEEDANDATTCSMFIVTLSNFYGDIFFTVYEPTSGDGGRTRLYAENLRKARVELTGMRDPPSGVSLADDFATWLLPNAIVLRRDACHTAAAQRAAGNSVGNLVVLLGVELRVASFASDIQRVWRGAQGRRLRVFPRARAVVQMRYSAAQRCLFFFNIATGTQWSQEERPAQLLGPLPRASGAPRWSDRAWSEVEELSGLAGPYWHLEGTSQVSTVLPSTAANALIKAWRRKHGALDFVLSLPEIAHALAFHQRRAELRAAAAAGEKRKRGRLATLVNKAVGLFAIEHDMRAADAAFAAALDAAAGSNPPVLLLAYALFTFADNRFPTPTSMKRGHDALAAGRYADGERGTFERAELFFFKWTLFAAAPEVEGEESEEQRAEREAQQKQRRARALRNFALVLQHVHRDLERAEKYFMKSLEEDPEDESTKANFLRLLEERRGVGN